MAEWLKAADCKSARASVTWFRSSPVHHLLSRPLYVLILVTIFHVVAINNFECCHSCGHCQSKNNSLTWVDGKEAIAGPGKSCNAPTKSKGIEPPINRRSMTLFLGRSKCGLKMGACRRDFRNHANAMIRVAPPITKAKVGSQFRKYSGNLELARDQACRIILSQHQTIYQRLEILLLLSLPTPCKIINNSDRNYSTGYKSWYSY